MGALPQGLGGEPGQPVPRSSSTPDRDRPQRHIANAVDRVGPATARTAVHRVSVATLDRAAVRCERVQMRTSTRPVPRRDRSRATLGVHAEECRAAASTCHRGSVDRGRLAAYFRREPRPGSRSIHEGVWKLPPGTVLTSTPTAPVTALCAVPVPYWSAFDVYTTNSGAARCRTPTRSRGRRAAAGRNRMRLFRCPAAARPLSGGSTPRHNPCGMRCPTGRFSRALVGVNAYSTYLEIAPASKVGVSPVVHQK